MTEFFSAQNQVVPSRPGFKQILSQTEVIEFGLNKPKQSEKF